MPPETLIDLFTERESLRARPDVLRHKTGNGWASISSEELGERVRSASQGLVSLGVSSGDRIALLSETRYEWTIADHAILAAGATTVPVYPTLLADQVSYILRDSEPVVMFCSTVEQAEKLYSIDDRPASLQHVVCFEPVPRAETLTLSKLEQLGNVRRNEHPGDFEQRAAAVGRDDLATIIYTSGTTGDPKGVMLTHDNLVQNVLNTLQVLKLDANDVALSFLPLSHVLERTAHYFILYSGAQIAYAESLQTVADDLREVQPTVMVSVPRLYEKIYDKVLTSARSSGGLKEKLFFWAKEAGSRHAAVAAVGGSPSLGVSVKAGIADRLVFKKIRAATGGRLSRVVSGGAPLAAEIAEFFYSAGIPICEGYGLTETSPVIAVNPPAKVKFGSVGPPIPGVEVKIAEDGEILTRSRSVMKGYYKKPGATAEVFTDGWFHTGDIGRFDEDGYIFITDRKKDIIVTAAGKNLAPQPIEAKLKESPLVAEAALIGDRRKFVVALIVPSFEGLDAHARASGIESASRAELLTHPDVRAAYQRVVDEVNANLPRYEQIKKFALLDAEFSIESGELTPTMKVKRRVVQEKFAALIDEMYGPEG